MYVTSATGLQIYDVSQPAAPRKLSQLPLPHFENEDVDVGRDTVVISNDPSFSNVGMIYLIDVSDPANPRIRSTLPTNIPGVTGDEELSEYARKVAHTVYHPAGTCRMGAADDELAVVDPELRIRGLDGIRIADASVFPTMTAVNPMIGVLMVGEKAADLMGGEA